MVRVYPFLTCTLREVRLRIAKMIILNLGFLSFFFFLFSSMTQAQDFFKPAPIFDRYDLNLKGRLRNLTLEDVMTGDGQEIVTLEREGSYPDWKIRLSVWRATAVKGKPQIFAQLELPWDVLFYGFLPTGQSNTQSLLLLRPNEVELWNPAGNGWERNPKNILALESAFSLAQKGQAEPFPISLLNSATPSEPSFLIPIRDKMLLVQSTSKGLISRKQVSISPQAFYKSSSENQPLELPFWMRSSLWYPTAVPGSLKGIKPLDLLFFPWMDEVSILLWPGNEPAHTHYFKKLSDAERDDAQSHVVTSVVDLNGDGRTDFVLNKFQGEATNLRAETTLYMTDTNGTIPQNGIQLKPPGNRAAGALPIDLNRDGKKDLVVASSQFNVWAVVRALVKRQVQVNFSFFMFHSDGYHLEKSDFEREISFRFDLNDLAIEGVLPSLDGDFNGDGYPDALYARDRRGLTVLIQKPDSKEPFSEVPSGQYDVSAPRFLRIGDLNGDRLSDVILYEKRSTGNRKVSVLINSGNLK